LVDDRAALRARVTELEAENAQLRASSTAKSTAALRARIAELEHRLWPDQGHGYANEVERQRGVIGELQYIAEELRGERDTARARVTELEALELQLRTIIAAAGPERLAEARARVTELEAERDQWRLLAETCMDRMGSAARALLDTRKDG